MFISLPYIFQHVVWHVSSVMSTHIHYYLRPVNTLRLALGKASNTIDKGPVLHALLPLRGKTQKQLQKALQLLTAIAKNRPTSPRQRVASQGSHSLKKEAVWNGSKRIQRKCCSTYLWHEKNLFTGFCLFCGCLWCHVCVDLKLILFEVGFCFFIIYI